MKKILLLVSIALVSMLNVMASTIVPETSTDGNDIWYYIKMSPRDPSDLQKTWATVMEDDTIMYQAYTGGDEQLWKVIAMEGGVALVNKKDGKYMYPDAIMDAYRTTDSGNKRYMFSKIYVKDVAPTYPLQIVPQPATYTYATPWTGWDGTGCVFITDNVVTTVDETTGEITHKEGSDAFPGQEPPFSFSFTSYGPTQYGAVNIAAWGGGNINKCVLFRTETEVGDEIRLALSIAIQTANDLLDKSSAGPNPGQFDADAVDGLQQITDYAQDTYDDEGLELTDYIDATTELYATIALFKEQINLPELSTTVDTWYYIQGTRPENAVLTAGAAGTGTIVKGKTVIPDDTQLWKLVENGEGFAIQNKATGEYIQTDIAATASLATQVDMPTSALQFSASSEATNNSLRFWINNLSGQGTALTLHMNSAGDLQNRTYDRNDNCTFLFLGEDEIYRSEFNIAKEEARAFYDASIEGNEFGQFTAEARATLNAVLVAEEAKDVYEMTQEELAAAKATVKDALAAFKANDDVSTLSSLTLKKWFRLVNNHNYGGVGYAANKAMTTNGRTVDQKLTYETINLDSDKQLFRFELNSEGTAAVAIVNKADSIFVGADGMILAEKPADVTFEITALDANSFWIKSGSGPLHAAASGTHIVNWNSGAGSASAWRFVFVESEEVTDFVTPFNEALTTARAKYDASAEFVGTEIGQYTVASMEAYEAIIVAEEAKDPETMTKEELIASIEALNAASSGLEVNTEVSILESTSLTDYKWYRLVNAMSGDGYASGMAMSSNGRLEDESYTWEEKDETSDYQLFRFKLNADKTKATYIVNKGTGLFVSDNGMLSSTYTSEFEITQLSDGRSFWVKPTSDAALHAAAAGNNIVNWENGAGSASAWYFEFVKEEAAPTEDLLAAYVAAKANARAYYDITIGGSEYSQFDEDARSTFLALIEAEEAKDQSTLTATELAEAASALEAGLATYKMALNSDPQGEGNFYRWFTLESAANPGKFLTVHPVNSTLYVADADETDNQLFRFEARPDFVQGETTTTDLYDIICKGTPGTWDVPGTIRCETENWDVVYGTSTDNFPTGNGDWMSLGYFPWQVSLLLGENGAQVTLISAVGDGVGAATGAEAITNIVDRAYDGESAWKITYVKTTVDVKTAQQSNIKIYTTNRMIVVKGTDAPVNVYNISGVEVDARKALRQGVYIVKVDGTTTKVVVE